MSRVELALRHIVDELARGPHAFALVGGFAVSARTEPRFTRDVDLVVDVPDDAAASGLVRELAVHGYAMVTCRRAACRRAPGDRPPHLPGASSKSHPFKYSVSGNVGSTG